MCTMKHVTLWLAAILCGISVHNTHSYALREEYGHPYDGIPGAEIDKHNFVPEARHGLERFVPDDVPTQYKRNSFWTKKSVDMLPVPNRNGGRDARETLDEQYSSDDGRRQFKRNSFWTKKSVDMASQTDGGKLFKDNTIHSYKIFKYRSCEEKCAAITEHCYRDSLSGKLDSVLCHVAKQICYDLCPPIH